MIHHRSRFCTALPPPTIYCRRRCHAARQRQRVGEPPHAAGGAATAPLSQRRAAHIIPISLSYYLSPAPALSPSLPHFVSRGAQSTGKKAACTCACTRAPLVARGDGFLESPLLLPKKDHVQRVVRVQSDAPPRCMMNERLYAQTTPPFPPLCTAKTKKRCFFWGAGGALAPTEGHMDALQPS